MEETHTSSVDEDAAMSPETPEDVAVLYTWANVHGGKYRDFSASRREYRAQQRHRMVEAQRQAELEAARAAEEAAARELEAARLAEAEAQKDPEEYPERLAEAEAVRRAAEENVERERMAAQRHVETAEELKHALEQAQREMEEARRRAEEQAARYAEADKRWRESQKERVFVPGATEDPYYFAGPLEPTAFAPGGRVRSSVPQRVSSESRITASYYRARESQLAESGEHRTLRRTESGNHFFSDSDSARRAVESDSEHESWKLHPLEQRIETPEDALERNRADEVERRDHSVAASARYSEVPDDGYYDRMPLLGEPRDAEGRSTRNSAQSDLHIPPRVQQTRTGLDALRAPAAPPPPPLVEDHASGSYGSESRRRRESATDLSTRTERRPRSSEPAFLSQEHGGEAYGEYAAGDDLRRDGRDYRAPDREHYPARDVSPEWLLKNRPAEDAARERLRADAREIALAAQQRLDEQQRRLDEERKAFEQARQDEDRRIAEADRRAAEETMRVEERRRTEGERLRLEQDRRREEDRRLLEEGRALAEAQQRVEEQRRADERVRVEERRREEERRRVEDERYRKEQERLHAEEKRRADEVARERAEAERAETVRAEAARAEAARAAEAERAETGRAEAGRQSDRLGDRPLRDSQMVRAADGGVNLRPLPDRPLMTNLPPLRDRPSQASSLPPLTDRPMRGVAAKATSGDPLPPTPVPVERRRIAREASSTSVPVAPAAAVPVALAAAVPAAALAAARVEAAPMADSPFSRAAGAEARPAAPRPAAEGGATPPTSRPAASTPADTLQQSRERVAARWFALKDLMNSGPEAQQEPPQAAARAKNLPTPCVAIVALSGGVGKTSLVATVGRALSSVGEKVLLADTTPHGLLPYYFGARELRPDVVRTFSPPPGSVDAPVYMVNYETDRLSGDEAKQQAMVDEMMRQARVAGRILLDLNGSSAWLARMMTRYHSNILVPIAPDMNSVLSIQSVDRFFSGSLDSEGRPVAPYYVLNQFDASLPLHLDVREVLRQQLGNRLLPVMIRRSPAVSEALAEGMTVIDYAPDSPVADDYKNLAEWVRKLAAPATTGLRSIRWSER